MIKARHTFVRAVIALSAVIISVATVTLGGAGAGAYTSTTDVVFVHGYGECQDVSAAGAGPLQSQYYFQNQAADKLHSVEYYGCDTGGESIVGAGPLDRLYFPSLDRHGPNTDIRHFSYELAWYLYEKFTRKGLPVDLVGHSMGGMILAFALQRVQARDPWFPPRLRVDAVVTFSTPFRGLAVDCTPRTLQCAQFTQGSQFTRNLVARGAAQPSTSHTRWVIVGSTGCDFVSPSSSEALPGVDYAIDYVSPCYDHDGYRWDYSDARDAVGTVNGDPVVGGMHSLALMQWALL